MQKITAEVWVEYQTAHGWTHPQHCRTATFIRPHRLAHWQEQMIGGLEKASVTIRPNGRSYQDGADRRFTYDFGAIETR